MEPPPYKQVESPRNQSPNRIMGRISDTGEEATVAIRIWVDRSIETSENELRQFLNGVEYDLKDKNASAELHPQFRESGELVGIDIVTNDELERVGAIDRFKEIIEDETGVVIDDRDVIISAESMNDSVDTYESLSVCEDPEVTQPEYNPLIDVGDDEMTLKEVKEIDTPYRSVHILATSMNSAEGEIKTYDPSIE